jgi:heptosyltransferase-2
VSDPARVVVRAPNWLGDAVMALPAMAGIRRAFAADTLIVAARGSIAPLFEERTPAAPDEILTLDDATETERLRSARAGTIVLLPNSFRAAWTARRSGIAERWGYATAGRGFLLTRRVARSRSAVHQAEYYAALARGLGCEVPQPAVPQLEASPRSRESAAAMLAAAGLAPVTPLVGFAPGAAYGHAKQWPPQRVAEVIARLAAVGIAAVLVGARDDRDTGRAIESSLPARPGGRMVNLIGRTSLRDLVGVIARCAAFVSNDSGAMHIAAALGVPLTAIFGPTDERATAPSAPAGAVDLLVKDVFCRPCMLRECPIDHRCMKRIDVDSVFASVMAHLSGRAGS